MRLPPVLVLLSTVGTLGCPASAPLRPTYPAQSTVKVAPSARCASPPCTCRSLEGGEDQQEEGIPAGQKRFELRLPKTTSAVWVEVGGRGVFYKAPSDLAERCVYVDLPVGEHQVTVHSEKRDPEVGLQTGLTLHEYGAKQGPSWYRALHFVCGGLNKCTRSDLETWSAFQRKLPRGVLDPCGSTMVRGVQVSGRRAEKGDDEYEELTVRFSVKLYAFEPYQSPGSSECKAPIKNR
ncbi:MAG: hypothetical protein IT371_16695 [Deltaproteobacteria bacterium]|nr:hypothetical protein [Deltaproteobacteria bacterium]